MLQKINNKITLLILLILLLGGSFYGGVKFEKFKNDSAVDQIITQIDNKDLGQPASIDFGLFWTALNKLEEQINGSFGGVGIEIGIRKNLLTVIAPIKDTPAFKAGILAGDIIIKINDKDADGLTTDEAVTQIRGKKGTSVKLTIQRNGDKDPREFNLTREEIKIPTIDWKLLEDNVAHIQLFTFNRNIDADFAKVAKEVLASKAEKIILDLRNNPGGILDSAVNIAGWFLDPNQTVVSEKFADKTETILKTSNNGQLKKYPLVIIINKGSASASEILAGALRDKGESRLWVRHLSVRVQFKSLWNSSQETKNQHSKSPSPNGSPPTVFPSATMALSQTMKSKKTPKKRKKTPSRTLNWKKLWKS